MKTRQQTTGHPKANKTDAGNGSKAICRVSSVLRSPSPDPKRSAKKMLRLLLLLTLLPGITGCAGYRESITTAKAQRGIVVNGDTGTPVIGAVVTSQKGVSSRQTEVDQNGEFVLDSYRIRHEGDAFDDMTLATLREPLLIRASRAGFHPSELRFVNRPNTLDTIFPDRIVMKLKPNAEQDGGGQPATRSESK